MSEKLQSFDPPFPSPSYTVNNGNNVTEADEAGSRLLRTGHNVNIVNNVTEADKVGARVTRPAYTVNIVNSVTETSKKRERPHLFISVTPRA